MTLDAIRARLGSIPDVELRKMRPSVRKLLKEDLPALLEIVQVMVTLTMFKLKDEGEGNESNA